MIQLRHLALTGVFIWVIGNGMLFAEDLMVQGRTELPISSGDEIHVFDFATQKINILKKKEYASDQVFEEAFKKVGDIYFGQRQPHVEGEASCYRSSQAFYRLSSLGTKCEPADARNPFIVSITTNRMFVIDTQHGRHALVRVDTVEDGIVTISWVYRTDGKCSFMQMPGESAEELCAKLFERARRFLELRRVVAREKSRWWQDRLNPEWVKMWPPIKGEGDPSMMWSPRSVGTAMREYILLCNFRWVRNEQVLPLALKYYEQVGENEKTEKKKVAATVLEEAGRKASALLVERLRQPDGLSMESQADLRKLLERIEGGRTERLLKEGVFHPVVNKEAPHPTIAYHCIAIPRTDPGDRIKISALDFAKGTDRQEAAFGYFSKPNMDPQFFKRTLDYVVKEGADVGYVVRYLLIPSKRYGTVHFKSLRDLNGHKPSEWAKPQKESVWSWFDQGVKVILQGRNGKHFLLWHIVMRKDMLCFMILDLGGAEDSIQIGELPSPLQVAKSGKTDVIDMVVYDALVEGERSAVCSENGYVPKLIQQIADGQSVVGVTLAQRSEAIRLLGQLHYWEASPVILEAALADQKEGRTAESKEKIEILKGMLPQAADKAMDMLKAEKDPKRAVALKQLIQEIDPYTSVD